MEQTVFCANTKVQRRKLFKCALLQKQVCSPVVKETTPPVVMEPDAVTTPLQSPLFTWKSSKICDNTEITKWDQAETHAYACFVIVKQQHEQGKIRKHKKFF